MTIMSWRNMSRQSERRFVNGYSRAAFVLLLLLCTTVTIPVLLNTLRATRLFPLLPKSVGFDPRDTTATFFECDYAKVPAPANLKVFQVYSEPPTLLMEHNKHYLPEGSEFVFYEHLDGMEASMREASRLLEHCGVVEGAYEALMDVRAMADRADIWRVAVLWMHGGLYMDHKMILARPFESFVDVHEDTILLPVDLEHTGTRAPVQNALLWSRPRHPVLAEILKHQVMNVKNRFHGGYVSSRILNHNGRNIAKKNLFRPLTSRRCSHHNCVMTSAMNTNTATNGQPRAPSHILTRCSTYRARQCFLSSPSIETSSSKTIRVRRLL